MFWLPLLNSGGAPRDNPGHIGPWHAMDGRTLSSRFTTAKKAVPRCSRASLNIRDFVRTICNSWRASLPNPAVHRMRRHATSPSLGVGGDAPVTLYR